jgi:hypothetical protein
MRQGIVGLDYLPWRHARISALCHVSLGRHAWNMSTIPVGYRGGGGSTLRLGQRTPTRTGSSWDCDWCILGRQPAGRVLTTWRCVARQAMRRVTNNDSIRSRSRGWRAVSRRCANRPKRQYLGALCREGKGRPWIRKTGHLGKCGECGACLPCLKPRPARLTGRIRLVHGWRRGWSRQQFGGYAGSLAARVKASHNVHSQQLGEHAGKPWWARTGAKLQSVARRC